MYDLIIRGGTVVDGTRRPAFTADVAITDGMIVEIGRVDGDAGRRIDADGALVAPGWIDPHTHYDGQATWDGLLEGSAANGVTTVVMGNCGVGFAPVASGGVGGLIELMEGVEDIPGTALYEGMPWGEWETFPEYVRFLDQRAWPVDVGTQLGHGPLRFYVMGARAVDDADATGSDVARMAELAEEAVRAGALGFSTSRFRGHRSLSGANVPGTFAAEDELLAIARAVARCGGVVQAVPSGAVDRPHGLEPGEASLLDEIRLFGRVSRAANARITFVMVQTSGWRAALDAAAEENRAGSRLSPMVSPRAGSLLTTLTAYHMFMQRPTYLQVADLPHAELVAALRRPEVKRAILAEADVDNDRAGSMRNLLPKAFAHGLDRTFPLRDPLDYEPDPGQSLAARATAEGRDPAEYVYDFLLEGDGTAVGVQFGNNYRDGNLDVCREFMLDPATVSGLSDAGAHVNFICDMSLPTFHLTHWVRDRTRGATLPLELVVAKATSKAASVFGLEDRGSIAVGMRADVNVIDLENLRIERPVLLRDLPAGGSRFLQRSTGYLATLNRGVLTRDHDIDTGARPGRVVHRVPPGAV